MRPCGFSFYQIGIQQKAAVIIKTGDEIPFRISVRGKLVMGRIVLNQFPCVVGQHIPVMGCPFLLLPVKAFFFCPGDYCRQGDLLVVSTQQLVSYVTVVEILNWYLGILNKQVFLVKLMKKVLFDLKVDFSVDRFSFAPGGKSIRISPEHF